MTRRGPFSAEEPTQAKIGFQHAMMVQYLQVTTKYTNLNTSQLKVDVYSFSSYKLLQIKILSGWHLMDLYSFVMKSSHCLLHLL